MERWDVVILSFSKACAKSGLGFNNKHEERDNPLKASCRVKIFAIIQNFHDWNSIEFLQTIPFRSGVLRRTCSRSLAASPRFLIDFRDHRSFVLFRRRAPLELGNGQQQ